MTKPVTLVTGFLGAGKTTFINRLLTDAAGLRIAAIVNDFGTVNIDAELIADRADAVIGLKNGCICCSLQGDLLRTLKQVISRGPACDHIVIEASGVADPQGVIEALMDPVVLEAVRLDAVICLLDVGMLADEPGLRDDPLWQAQLAAGDFVALAKTDGSGASARAERERLLASGKALVFDAAAPPPLALLLRDGPARPGFACGPVLPADRFATLEWSTRESIPLERFRRVMEELAPSLVRAKGIVNFEDEGATSFVFHLAGRRATIQPMSRRRRLSQLVLIGEATAFDVHQGRAALCRALAGSEGGGVP